MSKLPERLKELRLKFKLSQEKAAQRCGVSLMTWHSWEHGRSIPTLGSLEKVTAGFGVSLSSLIGG